MLASYNLLWLERERFETSPGLSAIRSSNDPHLWKLLSPLFLRHSGTMTKWRVGGIRRAADRCSALWTLRTWGRIDATCPRRSRPSPHDDCRSSFTGRPLEFTTYAPAWDADELLRLRPSYGARRYCRVPRCWQHTLCAGWPEVRDRAASPALWRSPIEMPRNLWTGYPSQLKLCDRAHGYRHTKFNAPGKAYRSHSRKSPGAGSRW